MIVAELHEGGALVSAMLTDRKHYPDRSGDSDKRE